MKYIISSGSSVVSNTIWRDNTLIGFSVVTENTPVKFDTYGDAMERCITINNLIGKHAFKVMTLNE